MKKNYLQKREPRQSFPRNITVSPSVCAVLDDDLLAVGLFILIQQSLK